MDAQQLVERVVKQFAENGIEFRYSHGWPGYTTESGRGFETGQRFYIVKEVYRRNGTAENVSACIAVYEVGECVSETCCALLPVLKCKVPKDASDKVIANRVKKAIEAFETGEPTR